MSETEGRKEDEEPGAPSRRPASAESAASDSSSRAASESSSRAASESSPVDEGAEGDVEIDEVDVRDLLRAALEPPAPKPKQDAVLLKGVQRRLRVRSKGKFYADGWSTSRSPRSTYLVTSIFMLLLIAFVFLVLIPWGNGALP